MQSISTGKMDTMMLAQFYNIDGSLNSGTIIKHHTRLPWVKNPIFFAKATAEELDMALPVSEALDVGGSHLGIAVVQRIHGARRSRGMRRGMRCVEARAEQQ